MSDRLAELEAKVAELSGSLKKIEQRLSLHRARALARGRAQGARCCRSRSAPASDAAAMMLRQDAASVTGTVSLAGRTLLVLAGAFFLRALTDTGRLPTWLGVGIAFVVRRRLDRPRGPSGGAAPARERRVPRRRGGGDRVPAPVRGDRAVQAHPHLDRGDPAQRVHRGRARGRRAPPVPDPRVARRARRDPRRVRAHVRAGARRAAAPLPRGARHGHGLARVRPRLARAALAGRDRGGSRGPVPGVRGGPAAAPPTAP